MDSTAGPLLTLVVAVYQIAGYVEEALRSVLDDDAAGVIRLVVVDDGSTDGSGELCDAVAAADARGRVRVVHQANAGVSAARNRGLELVETPYVGFLDGDDVVLPGFAQEMAALLAPGDADIIEFSADYLNLVGTRTGPVVAVDPDAPDREEMDGALLERVANAFLCYVWARVYRVALVRAYPFPVGRNYEDVAVLPSWYVDADLVVRTPLVLVGHRLRAGSIMHTPTLSECADWAECAHEALQRCDGSGTDRFWVTVAQKSVEGMCATAATVPARQFRAALVLARAERDACLTQLAALARPGGGAEAAVFRAHVTSIPRIRTRVMVRSLARRAVGRHLRARSVPA